MGEGAHGSMTQGHSGGVASEHGHMDIRDQKETFAGFLTATLWGSALVAMGVALLTIALAMGWGWFAGLAAFVAIGVAVGFVAKPGASWWAALIVMTVLLGVGGLIALPFTAGG